MLATLVYGCTEGKLELVRQTWRREVSFNLRHDFRHFWDQSIIWLGRFMSGAPIVPSCVTDFDGWKVSLPCSRLIT